MSELDVFPVSWDNQIARGPVCGRMEVDGGYSHSTGIPSRRRGGKLSQTDPLVLGRLSGQTEPSWSATGAGGFGQMQIAKIK